MIGKLPTQLEIDGQMYDIRTDYRDCMLIMEAFGDPEMSTDEATQVMLEILYGELPGNLQEAVNKAVWFLDCGGNIEDNKSHDKPVIDWAQDEQMIFAEINKVACREVRADRYMHFWTFIGLFQCVGEGLFSTVVSIRNKLNRGKSLDKTDQEFYDRNTNLVRLKPKRSAEEQERYDRINSMYS